MSRREREKNREKEGRLPPLEVTEENVEEIVRVLKAGLHNTFQVSDETKEHLGMWMTEREDEINEKEGRSGQETRDASPSSVGIQGELLPPPEEESDIHQGADAIIENPPLVWIPPDDSQQETVEAGSMEEAAAQKQTADWAANPPPHLRGGNP